MVKQLGIFFLHAVMLALLVLGFTTTAHGQTTIFERRTSDDARRQELLTLFQQVSEDYKEKERVFRIAKAQWESLDTLASLEELINQTRVILVARDRVAVTYAELILDSLEKSTGIEVTQKEMSIGEVKKQIEWHQKHWADSEKANTRELVNLRTGEFADNSEQFVQDTERALSLLAIGRLQTVIDKADALYKKILDYYKDHPGDTTAQVARQQKINQVEQRRGQLVDLMRKARVPSEDRKKNQRGFSSSTTINLLNEPYVVTSQYVGYLYELALAAGE